jgi:hypothetical protein
MFLPYWIKRMTTSPYVSLHRRFPHISKYLGSIPSDELQYADAPSQTHLDMHIIAIWNTTGRTAYAYNNNWLKELAKEIPEAKWEINSNNNDPYPSALCNEKTSGLIKVRKLSSNHFHQTPQGPQDKIKYPGPTPEL